MKSPKNRPPVATSHINNLLSPESKTRTQSRTKGSQEGCIRKQLLSPNSGSTWMDSVNREESLSRISKIRSPQNVCFSPTIQHSRVAVEGELEGNRSGIMAKLQELASVTTTHQTHIRKRTSDDMNSVYQRIEVNQWESEEIDKLKVELQRSYERMKEVRKRQKQTERKTLLLEQSKRLLEAQVTGLRQRCSKKDDIIFGLEQKLATVQTDYDSLHQKLSTLQLQVLSERNTSIQALKEHLLSFEKMKPLNETSLHVNHCKENQASPTPIDSSARLRREVEQLKGELNVRQLDLHHRQEQWAKQRGDLREQLSVVSRQLEPFKNTSPRELKKQREQQDMYLLYIQATSIESLLKQQPKVS